MKRLNYGQDLADWAREQNGKTFAWGQTDCASLARQAIAIVYDHPPALPEWTDIRTAIEQRENHPSIADCLARHGFSGHPIAFAQPGDILVDASIEPDGCGVALAGGFWLVSNPDAGIGIYPLQPAPTLSAWRL